MRHRASPSFWAAYHELPERIRQIADQAYARLREDPRHPALHLKGVQRFWAVRVGAHHRALGVDGDEGIVWFWIGHHDEYDRIVG